MKIIPTPRLINEKGGYLELCTLCNISVPGGSDNRIVKISAKLKGETEKLTGKKLKLTLDGTDGKGISIVHGNEGEGYTLDICEENGISIKGTGAAGAYYAVQTLRQIIHEYGDRLPCCHIEDEPDFCERGFYHDITRGRVPTLDRLCRIADELAYYKINSLQLYVEDAFGFVEYDGIMKETEVLDANEIIALDNYCYDNFIELIPSLATFGHLYNLLQSNKWKHLCEYENWVPKKVYWLEKMEHHTIDVSNDESIKVITSMIDQYIPLFRSDRFNICCDETLDLCREKNSGKDAGEEYFKFLNKIISHVKSRGKRVMMWGDIALKHPDKLSLIPEDTVMLNWTYEKEPKEAKVETLARAGLKQIVCPGTSGWNRFIEEIDRSEGNITRLVDYGTKYGALGVINTNWGDFGHIAPWNCNRYGMVLCAEKGWNSDGVIDGEFENKASALLYDSDGINIVDIIRQMGRCERTCDWMHFMYWYSANTVEGKRTELVCDTEKAVANNERLDMIIDKLKSFPDRDCIYTDLILACRGIRIMNRVHLRLKNHPEYQDGNAILADVEAWLVDYRAAWLRENKLSQLDRVTDFMREICLMKERSADS